MNTLTWQEYNYYTQEVLAKFNGDSQESPATSDGIAHYEIDWSKAYPCSQPDCIENCKFNLVIMVNGNSYLARSIHFDFE